MWLGVGRRGRTRMLREERELGALLVSDVNSPQALTQDLSPD